MTGSAYVIPVAGSLAAIVALGLVLVCAVFDIRTGRIPNFLTYPAIVVGLGLAIWPGVMPELGIGTRGLLAGALPAMVLFYVGAIGGGDVKLFAALGVLLGYPMIADVWLAAGLVGAAFAVALIAYKGRSGEVLRGAWLTLVSLLYPGVTATMPAQDLKVRFGPPIAIATCLVLLVPELRIVSEG